MNFQRRWATFSWTARRALAYSSRTVLVGICDLLWVSVPTTISVIRALIAYPRPIKRMLGGAVVVVLAVIVVAAIFPNEPWRDHPNYREPVDKYTKRALRSDSTARVYLGRLEVAASGSSTRYNRSDYVPYNVPAVNEHLGWETPNCKYAFYSRGSTPQCTSGSDRDHLVPLAEAHRSGRHSWSRSRMLSFSSYLDNLYVLNIGENRDKDDSDPDEWQPSNTGDHCDYAKVWIAVKLKWDLTVDTAERNALNSMLNTC